MDNQNIHQRYATKPPAKKKKTTNWLLYGTIFLIIVFILIFFILLSKTPKKTNVLDSILDSRNLVQASNV